MDDAKKEQEPRDLIDEYDAYLKAKKDAEEAKAENDEENERDQQDAKMAPASTFTQDLDIFDYMQ